MANTKDFTIDDLSAGYNDTDPPTSLAPNQCTIAKNVDFWKAPLGARRQGMSLITGSATLATKIVTFIYRNLPTGDETLSQLWAYASNGPGTGVIAYKDTAWHDVAFVDAADATGYFPFLLKAVTFHGKMFLAYRSSAGVDRLHVWDGTTLRRTGLAAPAAAPTAANTGVGTISGTRYYRVRETVQTLGTTILRSEPSSTLTFSPSGAGSGIQVTKPATGNTNATHWELEASLDNVLFYRVAITVIGTTAVTDTQAASIGYGTGAFTLSEDIGDYTTIISPRFLLVDQDRLVVGGSYENAAAFGSTVSWTPVFNDPGVGNDERIPLDTNNTLTLDASDGGDITGMIGPVNGVLYVFKHAGIYRLIRTGQRESAYEPVALTKTRGALESSIVEAVDETGRPAIYFLDPKVGPCRLGSGGLVTAGSDILNTWDRVNVGGTLIVAKSLYDPTRNQIHWWIAVDGLSQPTERITLQLDACRETQDGLRYGWTHHTGTMGHTADACLYASNIETGLARNLDLVPFVAIGTAIYKLDDTQTDAGDAFVPEIVSRPTFLSGSLNNRFGIRAGAIVGESDSTATVAVQLIRDFGRQTTTAVNANFTPEGTEDPVIVAMDNLFLSSCRAIQLRLTDGVGNTGNWRLQRIDMIPRAEETS